MLPTSEAISMAEEMGMNLVTMNDDEVPVCKIMDYSKYLYNQKKKQRQNHSSKVEVKEVKFNPVIAEHDMQIKAKTAARILGEGDKVKITIAYKGRMMQMISSGIEMLNNFDSMVDVKHNMERKPTIEGNRVYMVISPSK